MQAITLHTGVDLVQPCSPCLLLRALFAAIAMQAPTTLHTGFDGVPTLALARYAMHCLQREMRNCRVHRQLGNAGTCGVKGTTVS